MMADGNAALESRVLLLEKRLAELAAPFVWERLPFVLTPAQAAEALGISEWTAGEYCRQGVIPHRYIGKRLLISRDALRAWLMESGGKEDEEIVRGPLSVLNKRAG